MISALKRLLKRLPYPVILRLYYLYYLFAYLPRSERMRRRARLPLLRELDLERWKQSDVLVILGSGSSINRISAERWAAISKFDTVGFNFWPYHPFVPRMYFFESASYDHFPATYRRLVELMARRAPDYRDTVKVVMDLVHDGPQYLPDVPPDWRSNLYALHMVPAIARDESELKRTLRYLRGWGVFRPASRPRFLFKYRATLVALLALAAKLRYRKVLLCGIDLTRAEYFYQDPELYPETSQLEFRSRQARHPTFVTTGWQLGIDLVLMEMKRNILDPAGIEIYVENRSSALWPQVPEAPASLFAVETPQDAAYVQGRS